MVWAVPRAFAAVVDLINKDSRIGLVRGKTGCQNFDEFFVF